MEEKSPETKKRGRGRPRMYHDHAEAMAAYRRRKVRAGQRMDVYVNIEAAWRLDRLVKAWGGTASKAIERLILEADQRYESIIFPGTE
jgi:hypothetical protein